MNQRACAQGPSGYAEEKSPARPARREPKSRDELTPLETQLVECLADVGRSLSVKQLEARVPCASGELGEALDSLVEKRLLARLNTIIPSYVLRTSSDQVSVE